MLEIKVDQGIEIQTAVDKVKENGEGKIVITAGEHITGPIKLTSNLVFELEKGAILRFKDDPMLYEPTWTRWEGIECYAMTPLVYGKDIHNVTISGRGIIDGAGAAWWNKFREIEKENRTIPKEAYEIRLATLNPGYKTRTGGGGRPSTQFLRPPLVQFFNCTDVVLEGITLKNSPFWTLHTVYSKAITIRNMTFLNPADAINTDAIDIDSSEDVTITDCLIDVGDDGVTLKSGSGIDGIRVNKPTKNIRVTNCKILSTHGGIALGSETAAGISNVEVSDCVFQGSRRGIRLKSRRGRGGTIENIKLNNLMMDGCWCPISLEQYFAPGVLDGEKEVVLSEETQPVDKTTPHIKDIDIKNIKATNVRATAAFIVGLPEANIKNLDIENFDWSLASDNELLPTKYAEETDGHFHDDDRGIKMVNVSNITINGKRLF